MLAMEAAMSAMLGNELSSTIMDSRSHTRTATLPPSSSSHKNKDKAQQHHQQVHYVEPTSRNGVSGGGGKTTQYQDSGVDDARQLELEREIAFYKSITNHGGGGGGQEKKNHGTSLDIFAKGSIIGGDISQVKKVKTSCCCCCSSSSFSYLFVFFFFFFFFFFLFFFTPTGSCEQVCRWRRWRISSIRR
jgi:hypothetical protein